MHHWGKQSCFILLLTLSFKFLIFIIETAKQNHIQLQEIRTEIYWSQKWSNPKKIQSAWIFF